MAIKDIDVTKEESVASKKLRGLDKTVISFPNASVDHLSLDLNHSFTRTFALIHPHSPHYIIDTCITYVLLFVFVVQTHCDVVKMVADPD